MISLDRTNTNLIGRWWWTIDRWILCALIVLVLLGVLLIAAASPAIEAQHHWSSFYFIKKHLVFLAPTFAIMLGISFLSISQIQYVAGSLLFLGVIGLALTPLIGVEVKGAYRWLELGGVSLQPSEFVKPAFAVVIATLFARKQDMLKIHGNLLVLGLYGVILCLLLLQPDLGMAFLVTVIWLTEFFLAGLSLFWICSAGVCGVGGLVGAYLLFPHFAHRVDHFLHPEANGKFGDRYQILQSLQSFTNGGLLGQGPGEGTVKKHLPDAHADFIFAVAGEEFGFIFCCFLVILFAFIVLRSFSRLFDEKNLFVILAVVGLITQFGLQAIINMASTLNLMPTKGMTLPFISYGGSSMLALAIGMGMVLGLTRRRVEDYGSSF